MGEHKAKSFAAGVAECALFVALMVAAAFIRIPFPIVPLTFQTVVGVLSGLLLGAKKGAVSMAVYCFAGLVGIPVFTAGGGFAYVLQPTFGYIIGFIPSALTAGIIAGDGTSAKRVTLAAIAAFSVDYLVGIPYCMIVTHMSGTGNLFEILVAWNLLYVPKDFALCMLAAAVARQVRPQLDKLR